MSKTSFMAGRSLIEVIAVISITIYVIYLGITGYQNFIDQQRVNSAAEDVVNLIEKARSRTLSSQGGTSGYYYYIYVDKNANKVVLRDQTGTTLETVDFSQTPVQIDQPAGFYFAKSDCVAFSDDVRFERLTGDAKIYDTPAPGYLPTWYPICTSGFNSFTLHLKKSPTSAPSRTIKILNTGTVQIL